MSELEDFEKFLRHNPEFYVFVLRLYLIWKAKK